MRIDSPRNGTEYNSKSNAFLFVRAICVFTLLVSVLPEVFERKSLKRAIEIANVCFKITRFGIHFHGLFFLPVWDSKTLVLGLGFLPNLATLSAMVSMIQRARPGSPGSNWGSGHWFSILLQQCSDLLFKPDIVATAHYCCKIQGWQCVSCPLILSRSPWPRTMVESGDFMARGNSFGILEAIKDKKLSSGDIKSPLQLYNYNSIVP